MTFNFVGKLLKNRRLEMEYSQAELSRLSGIHVQFISNWERGKCEPPAHSRKKLMKILKVSRSEMEKAISWDLQYLQVERINGYGFKP